MFDRKNKKHLHVPFAKPQSKSHKKRNALILGGSLVAAILLGASAKESDAK